MGVYVGSFQMKWFGQPWLLRAMKGLILLFFALKDIKGMTPIGISFYLILPASDNQDRRLQGHKL